MNCAIFQVLNSNWDTWGLKDNSEWGHVCVCVCVTCFKLEKKTFKKTGPLDKYLRLLGQQSYLRMSKEIHETKAQGHPYKVWISLALSEALLSPVPLLSDFTGYQLIFTLINRPQDLQTFS